MNTKKKKVTHPREDVSKRLKIAKGHLEKTIEMVDSGIYCVDVMQQTTAVRNAIKRAEEILLLNHLKHCVASALKTPEKNKEVIDELSMLFKKM